MPIRLAVIALPLSTFVGSSLAFSQTSALPAPQAAVSITDATHTLTVTSPTDTIEVGGKKLLVSQLTVLPAARATTTKVFNRQSNI